MASHFNQNKNQTFIITCKSYTIWRGWGWAWGREEVVQNESLMPETIYFRQLGLYSSQEEFWGFTLAVLPARRAFESKAPLLLLSSSLRILQVLT